MDLAMDLAGASNVDLVLANDPDADRCAVGIPVAEGGFGCSPATRWVPCSAGGSSSVVCARARR